MHKYILHGKVLPERADFSVSCMILGVEQPDSGLKFDMALSILKSQISVHITSESEILDYETLRNYVVDVITMHTDAFCYINGYAYGIEITSLAGENNTPYIIFGAGIDVLEKDHVNRPYKTIGEIIHLIYNPKYNMLRVALSDLRLAIQFTKDTPFFCYRAIESLMQYFNKYNDEKKAWSELRSKLNISEDYIISGIKPLADDIRHGKSPFISATVRNCIMLKTWRIIDRFIIYVKNNEIALDRIKCPELM